MLEVKVFLLSSKLSRLFINSNLKGKIHSRFENAINIDLDDGFLFNFLPNKIPPNPRSLLLPMIAWNRIQNLPLSVGMEVYIEDNRVEIPSLALVISFRESEVWDPSPLLPGPPVLEVEIHRNLKEIAKVIEQKCNNENRSLRFGHTSKSSLKAFGDNIKKGAADLYTAILNSNLDHVLKSSCQLIGLGPGLTPSGDDLVAGVMATGVFCALAYEDLCFDVQKINTQIMVWGSGRTTIFSQILLSDASRGEVVRPLGELLQMVLCGNDKNLLGSLVCQVMALGASSGKDMLDGVLLGMEAFLRLKNDILQQNGKRKMIQHAA